MGPLAAASREFSVAETVDVVRLYYFNDEMPYFIDHGPPLAIDDRIEIEGVPFRVFRVRNIPDNEEQRLWIE